MPAQLVLRRRRNADAVRQDYLALSHAQLAQQTSDAVEHAARVGAGDRNRIARGFDLIAFGRERSFTHALARRAADRYEWSAIARRLIDTRPAQLRALLDL